MVSLIELYNEASGSNGTTLQKFEELLKQVPDLPSDEHEAVISIKEALKQMGFTYNRNSVTLKKVLGTRTGDCLSFPILIGSIMETRGFQPKFQIIVNPKDFIYSYEKKYLDSFNEETPYNAPKLATEIPEAPFCRFAPLEHLVIETPRGLIETTSKEHIFPGCESARRLTSREAVSCIYQDLTVLNLQTGKTKHETLKKLLDKAIEFWEGNRQAHAIAAKLAFFEKNLDEFARNRDKFLECGGEDSHFYFQRYVLANNHADLEKALEVYPPYAEAIAARALLLSEKDKREARFLYSLASNLYANSSELDYPIFLITHAEKLKELFGSQDVKDLIREVTIRKN